jgi:hypothetical protein
MGSLLLLLRGLAFFRQFRCKPGKALFIYRAQVVFVAEVKVVSEPLLVMGMRCLRDGLVEEQLLKSGDNLSRYLEHIELSFFLFIMTHT